MVECVAGLEIQIILFGVAHEEAVSFEQPCVIKWVDAVDRDRVLEDPLDLDAPYIVIILAG